MYIFFFFNDTATTEIYTLSLHDALPICARRAGLAGRGQRGHAPASGLRAEPALLRPELSLPGRTGEARARDRKSTRLNSSHSQISYAVFCLNKKKAVYTLDCHRRPIHFK